jgi:hypothetical protein
MAPSQQWLVNKSFLNAAVKRGGPIILASPPWLATKGSWYAAEIAYLRSFGYRTVYRNGQWQMIR